MAANFEPILTIADLEAIPEDGNCYELIEGELFVSRAPSLKHQDIVLNIGYAFKKYLAQYPIGKIWPGPGVIFSNISGVIPDLVYLSNESRAEIALGERVEGAPDLIIEILSPGSENERRDRQVKRQLYSKFQVKEYWIIDPEAHTIEIFRAKEKTGKRKLSATPVATLRSAEKITSPLLPDFHCLVQEFFQDV